MLKTKEWISVKDMPAIFESHEALEAVCFFFKYKRLGLPYPCWAECPNRIVEIIDMLSPLFDLYYPAPQRLF